MKRFLFIVLLTWSGFVQAQSFNNEWIDYNKTYYKLFVGANGLYRINQSVLAGLGIGNTPAEQFQLWRNGEQVPVFTSVPTGTLGAADFIEFFGEMNDGRPDKIMYRVADHQLNDKWSLETDTAAYFLTINPAGNNLRMTATSNNLVAGATPEPFFYHTLGVYYKQRINPGYAAIVGSAVYSSSYDQGEGWTSTDIGQGTVRTENLTGLFPFTGTGANTPILRVNALGNALNPRRFSISVNGTQYDEVTMDYFDYVRRVVSVPVTAFAGGTAAVAIRNMNTSSDRMALAQMELIYPRLFNFGGANQFAFQLSASASGNYLEISGFNHGGVAPILYDFTNGQRYLCDIATPGVVKVQLLPASGVRRLQLISQATGIPQSVTSITQRNFVNYSLLANQGNYLMITHASLTGNVGATSPVEDYRSYRSSVLGGGHSAKVYLIDQLIDQFAFGIRLHPLSVRNFIRYARATFAAPVKNVMLLGKGVEYVSNRNNLSNPDLNRLSFIPTFGTPASDILLAADPGLDVRPKVSIGRLSAVNAQEVRDYLDKVVQYEQQQLFNSPLIRDKAWTKNVVHVNGSGDGSLGEMLAYSLNGFNRIVSDSMYGANVYDFTKLSSAPIEQVSSLRLYGLFEEGIGMLTYFGHSSATTLEFNLDNPTNYNNQGKYPLISILGCNAGNFYTFNTVRLQSKETISEKFVLAKDRGAIGVLASSGLGIVNYLDIYQSSFLRAASTTKYGLSVGDIMQEGVRQVFNLTTQEDFFARVTCEQTSLHGDPAVSMNASSPKPDYAIEASYLKISPSFISVAETSFRVQAIVHNLGKALPNKIVLQLKRIYPDQSSAVIISDTINGIRFSDTLVYDIPIAAQRDKGQNRIEFCIDPDNLVDEAFESNNCAIQDFVIFEDEARPISPADFSIVSSQNILLSASTANPLAISRQYRMEIDTTTLFNSPLKYTQTLATSGGILEFMPGVNFQDSIVYYWRVAPIPTSGNLNWNTSSFVFIQNGPAGFQQSHFYQHTESSFFQIQADTTSRAFRYTFSPRQFFAQNGIFPFASGQGGYYYAAVDNRSVGGAGCAANEILFNVLHPYTLKPWVNNGGAGGQYGSGNNCGAGLGRETNFRFPLGTVIGRKAAMDFIDLIPPGYFVVLRTNASSAVNGNTYANQWMTDTSLYGSGVSLYHKLKIQGFAEVDSFNAPKSFNLFFAKNGQSTFPARWGFSPSVFEGFSTTAVFSTPDTVGLVSSPWFGPMKSWTEAYWDGKPLEPNPTEVSRFSLIGLNAATQHQDTLLSNITQLGAINISNINARQYPFLRMTIRTIDTTRATPWNLRSWRLAGSSAPEGAIAPNVAWQFTDTVQQGQPHSTSVAFKNTSFYPFDSVFARRWVIDRSNVRRDIPTSRRRPLFAGDTLLFSAAFDTRNLPGANQYWVEVNPDNDQPELFHFNNLLTKPFYVKPDSIAPLLDVTFDGLHILDNDIVSAAPFIKIRLRDQSNWMLLNDTSVMQIQARYPNGQLRRFYFSGDTLTFYPPNGAAPTTNNEAIVDFLPSFDQDGAYELIIQAKDLSNNQAGRLNYRTNFQVINAAQVSDLLNYPNPFTSSTSFVFTLTGREIPDQFKIEILTVTGKVIREINLPELGPLRIGRNITEFKWDGTDQFGQPVANGVYLYRAVVSKKGSRLNTNPELVGTSLPISTKGYGKMYLMR
jgi:hypothetical protein